MTDYVVTCLTDEGERVQVTRKTFTRDEAEHYVKGVAKSREPQIEMLCIFCKVEWRRAMDDSNDWPRCINCRAC